MAVVEAEKLTKFYGRRIGIADLNLSLPQGTLLGFLGPNGAGKTTAIRVLLGFLRATRGRAAIFGWDCWRQAHRILSDVGYLPGDLRLYPWLTAARALQIIRGARGRDVQRAGRDLAEQFALETNLPVRHMSRGTRQKLGLILALVHRPMLLILDEPATGLDPLIQDVLFAHLRSLAGQGHTVLFSTHTLSEVERLCDRVAILREGRLVTDERLDVLRARARRNVTLLWRDDADGGSMEAPSFLIVNERNGRLWRGTLSVPAVEFVRWCADKPLVDVSIGQPDLADLFREYYRSAGPNA